MNKLISLIKTDFNITFGISAILSRFKRKNNRFQIIILAVALLSLIPSYALLVKGLWSFYDQFQLLGQKSSFLLMGFLSSQIMMLLFGILYVMSKYYFSNDLNHLLPLPIKPSYIITSKFVTTVISEYITALPIFLPFVIIFGIKESAGILYWIYALVASITIPILPIVIDSIIVMVFMKYTSIGRRKDLIRTLSSIIFLIIMVYVQLKIQNIVGSSIGEDFLYNLAKDVNLLANKMGAGFPPSIWGAIALGNYNQLLGLTNLIMFILVSIISFVLMIWLSEKIFLSGLIGNNETSAYKQRGNKDIGAKSAVNRPYIALAKKEIKMLLKTPVYLMNSLGGVILIPIIMIMSMVTGEASFEPLRQVLQENKEIVALAAIGFIGILGLLNNVTSTTFSREGKNFWIQRTLPISSKDQIFGRMLAALIVNIAGAIAALIGIYVMLRIDIYSMILIAVIGIAAGLPMSQIGMIVDISRPMLDWTNPQQAMKQNFNVLFSMAIGVLYGGAIFVVIRFLMGKIDMSFIYVILVGIILASTVIFYIILKKLVGRQFMELEG